MPALDSSVKYFDSEMAGAPTLNNTAGALLAVLDACLVNGFGMQTASSVVVTGGVAVATVPSTPAVRAEMVVTVAGATPAGLNGDHKVISANSTTITFDAFGVADGTATGSITIKAAAAGWEKAFSGTNLAAYRSLNAQASAALLKVNDTGTTAARVVGYESMTDINTGAGPFPTEAQKAGGGYFQKSSSAAGKKWFIVANDRVFYFGVAPYLTYPLAFYLVAFGDICSKKTGDAFRSFLVSNNSDRASGLSVSSDHFFGATGAACTTFFPRSYSAIGGAVAVSSLSINGPGGLSGISGYTFPNPEDNGLMFSQVYAIEGNTVRGHFPGIYTTPFSTINAIPDAQVLDETVSFAKKMIYRNIGNVGAATGGGVFFDTTGPWQN